MNLARIKNQHRNEVPLVMLRSEFSVTWIQEACAAMDAFWTSHDKYHFEAAVNLQAT